MSYPHPSEDHLRIQLRRLVVAARYGEYGALVLQRGANHTVFDNTTAIAIIRVAGAEFVMNHVLTVANGGIITTNGFCALTIDQTIKAWSEYIGKRTLRLDEMLARGHDKAVAFLSARMQFANWSLLGDAHLPDALRTSKTMATTIEDDPACA